MPVPIVPSGGESVPVPLALVEEPVPGVVALGLVDVSVVPGAIPSVGVVPGRFVDEGESPFSLPGSESDPEPPHATSRLRAATPLQAADR